VLPKDVFRHPIIILVAAQGAATQLGAMPNRLLTIPSWFRLALLLFLGALAWRLPYTFTVQTFFVDEREFQQPTIAQILRGEFPIYLYSNAYMAPVQEWMSAGLISLWGQSLATLRLPCVLFGCLAIVLSFRNLQAIIPTAAAVAICLLLVCTNSYSGLYSTFGVPSYAIAMLLTAAIQWSAVALDKRRTIGSWIAFGALGGLSAYVFKIVAIQFGVALIWLLLRSDAWKQFVFSVRDSPHFWNRLKLIMLALGVGILAVAPAMYRYLTRPDSYRPGVVDGAGLLFAVPLGIAALWLSRPLMRAKREEWARIGGCVLIAAIIYLPPDLYFKFRIKPALLSGGMTLWEGSRYSWKHAHEWPLQISLFLERVIPTLLIGRMDELPSGFITSVDLGWRSALSTGLIGTLMFGAIRRWRAGARPSWSAPEWLLITPYFIIVALMLPSWKLNNDWCGRYLLVFQAGLWLAVYLLFQASIHRHSRIWGGTLAAYLIYCGIDTFLHTPP
jgi:hypothetical protein